MAARCAATKPASTSLLWIFQRVLYALEPKNEYPLVPGKVWPKPFARVLDPIVTLASVAAATTRIRLDSTSSVASGLARTTEA